MPNVLTSEKGALWVQPDGPNTETFFLGCHDVSDLTEGGISKTLQRCFRPDGSGWNVVGQTTTPPDPITLTITSLLFQERDWLERVKCPYALYLLMRDCGSANVFNNYVRGQLLTNVENTQRSFSNLAMREEDAEATVAIDVEAWPPLLDIDQLVIDRIATTESEAANDVVGNDNERCVSDCGETLDKGEHAGAAIDAINLGTANVLFSTDEGLTWTAGGADPFDADEHIVAIQRFMVGRDTVRWLVGENGAGAAVQGEVAYSDNAGTAWTPVSIGAAGQGNGPVYGGGIFALDQNHIWMCGAGGVAAADAYIWFSADGGETWTTQEAGIISANAYSQIHFADELHGMAVDNAADVVVYTEDGGSTWAAVTATGVGGPLQCVHMLDANRAWVGGANGEIWFTNDAGVTWEERTGWNVTTGIDVRDIDFANEYQGLMVVNSAGPIGHVYYTTDGGYTWELLTTPDNDGLNAVWIAKTPDNRGLAYVVGEPESATAVILKVSIV